MTKLFIEQALATRGLLIRDNNKSESSIGCRKWRKCRDHIFVANSAIQDALSSRSAKPLNLFVCDYKTMFDSLDVKTTLNDLCDNGVKDNSFALLQKLYETSKGRVQLKILVVLTT